MTNSTKKSKDKYKSKIATHGWKWSLAGAACAVMFTLAIIFNIL